MEITPKGIALGGREGDLLGVSLVDAPSSLRHNCALATPRNHPERPARPRVILKAHAIASASA